MCVFNSFPPLLPLPACSPACLRPPPSLSYTQGELASKTHSHTRARTDTHTQARRLHEWEAGANPKSPRRATLGAGLHHGAGGRHTGDEPLLPWPLALLSTHTSLLRARLPLSPSSPSLGCFLHLLISFSLWNSPCSVFFSDSFFTLPASSQPFRNFLLPCRYFSVLPSLLSFVLISSPRSCLLVCCVA